jgi:hypothetical protein
MQGKKILTVIFVILLIITLGELVYYFWYSNKHSNPDTNNLKIISNTQIQNSSPTQISAERLSNEDISFINNSYYWQFLPLKYDEQKNIIYINQRPKEFLAPLKNMGLDLAAWISISKYTKGQVESFIGVSTLKGIVSELNAKSIVNGKKYLTYVLTGKDGTKSTFWYNESYLKKATIVQSINGKMINMELEKDLKNGDNIIIEEKLDLTKPPSDPLFTIDAKITKL